MASVNLRARILDRHGQGANENVRRQAAQFRAMPELCQLLDALPHPLLILNEEREIVFANRRLMDLIGLANPESVHGLRPGDVLNCEHAWNDRGGCGTTEACQVCGAACAISHAQHGTEATQECRILQTEGAALDLHAISTLFCLAGESFTVLALTDVSHEKRRQVLERVFFHDMLNVTASLMGYADLLVRVPTEEVPELSRLIARCVRDLANELRSHRDLALAEAHDLKVHWEPVNTHQVMAGAIETSRTLEAAVTRRVVLHAAAADVTFASDKSLLARVLGNMIKNALEATPPEGVVTIGCDADDDNVDFWVHNESAMPREVQLQVFQRSFSTKGQGRGVGTYSIKLLTELYLNGEVSFASTPETGTTFRVSYPRTEKFRD